MTAQPEMANEEDFATHSHSASARRVQCYSLGSLRPKCNPDFPRSPPSAYLSAWLPSIRRRGDSRLQPLSRLWLSLLLGKHPPPKPRLNGGRAQCPGVLRKGGKIAPRMSLASRAPTHVSSIRYCASSHHRLSRQSFRQSPTRRPPLTPRVPTSSHPFPDIPSLSTRGHGSGRLSAVAPWTSGQRHCASVSRKATAAWKGRTSKKPLVTSHGWH